MSRTQIIAIILAGVLIVVGIPLTLFLISQQQDPRSRASEIIYPENSLPEIDTTVQQSNEPPAAPANVLVEYPNVVGENFNLEEASCSWISSELAASYNLKITEKDTNRVLREENIPSSTNRVVFPVNQGFTYVCDVAAVSSTGAVSAVSSDEALCEVEGLLVPTPTPTSPPPQIATPTPTVPIKPSATPTPPVKATATPTIPPTGSAETILVGAGVAGVIMTIGAFLLFY